MTLGIIFVLSLQNNYPALKIIFFHKKLNFNHF